MKFNQRHIGPAAAGLAFLVAFAFFLLAYPYHLIRREHMNLFVYDWDYIRQTYRGVGWLARFGSDFVDQFLRFPVVGPVIIALVIVGIAAAAYRICRHFLGKWPSLAISAVFYIWSFSRETENYYCTQYSLVMLGFLVLVLAALRFRKAWMKPVATVLFIAFGVWALGSPVHKYWGKPWGLPNLEYDKIIGLDAEIEREHWDKVMKRSGKDLYMTEASCCYNLAFAMNGQLGHSLFNYAQNYANGLLFWITTDISQFSSSIAGEAWFHLGNMTLAEQSAMIALQASPKHTGARYLVRLAKVNLINGEDGAAEKYLGLLGKTLCYGKWARSMMPGRQDEAAKTWIAQERSKLAVSDFVYSTNDLRPILLGLLEANPSNRMAREYLLCYDLLILDLEHFMEDYSQDMIDAPVYQEGVLIWLSMRNEMTAENAARYGIGTSAINRMERFFRYPDNYRNTYWYYYTREMERLYNERP